MIVLIQHFYRSWKRLKQNGRFGSVIKKKKKLRWLMEMGTNASGLIIWKTIKKSYRGSIIGILLLPYIEKYALPPSKICSRHNHGMRHFIICKINKLFTNFDSDVYLCYWKKLILMKLLTMGFTYKCCKYLYFCGFILHSGIHDFLIRIERRGSKCAPM